ncbi:response regulator [Caballeronia grimmiae]|uniref:hypothetical protein n=1 Tax=Caballeronia grimmiae TaxID=1071679 RepID=UPI0038B7F921
MVVEDDYLVALGLSAVLAEAGAHVVGPVAGPREAVALIEESRETVDAAVLDVDLNGEKSYPVADALALRDIRFIFATGYGSMRWLKAIDTIRVARSHLITSQS